MSDLVGNHIVGFLMMWFNYIVSREINDVNVLPKYIKKKSILKRD